ncbi:alternative oxidase, partial [Baffinella frigidus]
VDAVKQTHVEPTDMPDRLALMLVKMARWSFDTFSGYRFGEVTYNKVLNRAIFLETVAGVPGMAAGMLRHLRSLRRMDRDHGWIHTLLEEAENERMHLLTFIQLKQ